MITTEVADGLFQINLLAVHAFFSIGDDGVTLIDTGTPNRADRIDAGLQERGFSLRDVRHLVLTHLHTDHVGSAASVIERSGARVYAHHGDAPAIQEGRRMRPSSPGPGILPQLMAPMARLGTESRSAPIHVEQTLAEGDELSFGGGFRVIHTPGHTIGHISLEYLRQPVLVAADAAANVGGLRPPFILEDRNAGYDSLRRLAGMDPKCTVFGHGAPLFGDANDRWKRFVSPR